MSLCKTNRAKLVKRGRRFVSLLKINYYPRADLSASTVSPKTDYTWLFETFFHLYVISCYLDLLSVQN